MRFSATAVAALLFHSSAESFGSLLSHLAGNFGRRAAATLTATRTTSCSGPLKALGSGSARRSLYSNSLFVNALAASSQYTPQSCPGTSFFTTTSRSLSARGGTASATMSSTALNSAVSECAQTEKPAPVEVFRNDYRPLPYFVTKVNMDFNIQDGKTTVVSELYFEPNPDALHNAGDDMVLDGDESSVKLMKLMADGRDLVEGEVCVHFVTTSQFSCRVIVYTFSVCFSHTLTTSFVAYRNMKSCQES